MAQQELNEDRRWLTPGVWSVGTASFLSDSGHEMASSVLPTFVTSLGAGPAALGGLEGVSEALIGLSRLAGGPIANDPSRRAKLATGGYVVTAVATSAMGLATAIWQVGLLRAVAWMSRGLRSPAKGALLVSLVPRSAYGRATGVERAGDNAGAMAGPLMAAVLVGIIGVRQTILLAIVPGMLAALAITVAAREARRSLGDDRGRRALSFNLRELRHAGLGRALIPAALFEFGNVATTLLILRATDLLQADGRDLTAATTLAILLYALHNAAAAGASVLGGRASDRVNPRRVLAAAAGVYVVAYGLFALDLPAWPAVATAFVLAGIGIGLAETAESTVVALLLPDRLRGNGFGVLGLIQSFGDLGASVVVGVLWAAISPAVAFCYAASWMAASVGASILLRGRKPLPGRRSAE